MNPRTISLIESVMLFDARKLALGREFMRKRMSAVYLAASTVLVLAGCSQSTSATKAPPPPDVEVVQVEQKDVPIYGEWIGTLDGMVNADIKAQVSGYLLKQDYTEGSFVRKGQLLFEIDPRPFQA